MTAPGRPAQYGAWMAPRLTETSSGRTRELSVALLVSGVALFIVAATLRVASGPSIDDATALPGELFDQGRLSAARSMVCLLMAMGLCWIGSRGVAGAKARWMTQRLLMLALAALLVAAMQGLWLIACACALAVAACGVRLRIMKPEGSPAVEGVD